MNVNSSLWILNKPLLMIGMRENNISYIKTIVRFPHHKSSFEIKKIKLEDREALKTKIKWNSCVKNDFKIQEKTIRDCLHNFCMIFSKVIDSSTYTSEIIFDFYPEENKAVSYVECVNSFKDGTFYIGYNKVEF